METTGRRAVVSCCACSLLANGYAPRGFAQPNPHRSTGMCAEQIRIGSRRERAGGGGWWRVVQEWTVLPVALSTGWDGTGRDGTGRCCGLVSFTLEASFCGADAGRYAGHHFNCAQVLPG